MEKYHKKLKSMKKTTFLKEDKVINHETGEIIETRKITESRIDNEPAYIKLYIEDVIRLNNLPSGTGKVLNCLLRHMSYSNTVVLIKPIKDLIGIETNLSANTVKKAIADLNNAGILIRSHKSVYLVDPNLFGRGKWENIKELRMTVKYDKEGVKTITSNLTQQLRLEV